MTAEYTDYHGTVQFGIGVCEMNAMGDALVIRVQAEDEEKLTQVKHVVADHLERFSGSMARRRVNPSISCVRSDARSISRAFDFQRLKRQESRMVVFSSSVGL